MSMFRNGRLSREYGVDVYESLEDMQAEANGILWDSVSREKSYCKCGTVLHGMDALMMDECHECQEKREMEYWRRYLIVLKCGCKIDTKEVRLTQCKRHHADWHSTCYCGTPLNEQGNCSDPDCVPF